jgi:SpoIID/LytB domain protein
LDPLARGPSGRIYRLKITGERDYVIIGKELEIRRALSRTHLYSSAFVVEKEDLGSFFLRGAGWGHGVGLCQIGAAVMANEGKTYADILQHYYRGTTVSA